MGATPAGYRDCRPARRRRQVRSAVTATRLGRQPRPAPGVTCAGPVRCANIPPLCCIFHNARQSSVRATRDRNPPDQPRVPMKTYTAKSETVQRDWYLVDASGKTLGRLAAELAHRLRGKHKPVYTPHVDTVDYLVVVNAEKIAVTGNKLQDKMYYRF